MDLDLSPEHLRTIVVMMITLILSVTVHEFGHALVADRLGDRLPRNQGRVTLSPLAHADPVGTLLVPGLGMLLGGFGGFGWGRPVQVNPVRFSRRFSMRTGHMMVAFAGPAMNVLFGMFIGLVAFGLYRSGVLKIDSPVYGPLLMAIQLNFILAIFNLLPVPPLDGGTVLIGIAPRAERFVDAIRPYGIFILIALMVIPWLNRAFVTPAVWLTHLWGGTILSLPGL